MRVLVTFGSERGGTEDIAHWVADELRERGLDVALHAAEDVSTLEGFDAVVVGGALYANLWPRPVRRFVRRNVRALRRVPVFFFSSGPLDDSATKRDIPPPGPVAVLMERVGALGHATFGGRLEPDAKGFPASAMAANMSGDWRDETQIRAWAAARAAELPEAKPGRAIDHPGGSAVRLLAYGAAGWALCAATMGVLLAWAPSTWALTLHAIAAPLVFFALSRRYFAAHGARDPLPAALTFTGIAVVLDALAARPLMGDMDILGSFAGTWLPLGLIFLSTWVTGAVMLRMPDAEQLAQSQGADKPASTAASG